MARDRHEIGMEEHLPRVSNLPNPLKLLPLQVRPPYSLRRLQILNGHWASRSAWTIWVVTALLKHPFRKPYCQAAAVRSANVPGKSVPAIEMVKVPSKRRMSIGFP